MPPAVSVCAGKLAMALHARGGGFSQHMAQRTIAQAWFALRYQQSAHIRLRFATSWILRMTTVLITHPACLNHLTPSGHPERPDRLRAIERALEHERFQNLARLQAPAARNAASKLPGEIAVSASRRTRPSAGVASRMALT